MSQVGIKLARPRWSYEDGIFPETTHVPENNPLGTYDRSSQSKTASYMATCAMVHLMSVQELVVWILRVSAEC